MAKKRGKPGKPSQPIAVKEESKPLSEQLQDLLCYTVYILKLLNPTLNQPIPYIKPYKP